MAVDIALPTLGTVLVTALVDSVNPCAIGVLILLFSTLLATNKKKKILLYGSIYILMVYVTYFSAGLGLTAVLANIPQKFAEYISIAVGIVVVGAGLLEIKDFYWYGHGISLAIPQKRVKQIHKLMQTVSAPTAMGLGVFVAAVELPCTGGPYLAITLILSQNFNFSALVLLAIYNVIFVMPLVVIMTLALFGTKMQDLKRWKNSNKAYMRLAIGLILIALGWLLMLIANGTINLT